MLKADIIKEVQKDEYKNICKKLSPYLWQDLYQELLLILLEKEAEPLEKKLNNINDVRYYTVGILLNMVRSNNSKFHKSFRNTVEITHEVYDPGEHDYELDKRIDKLEEIVDGQYWFDKHIFKTYLEEGSLRKTAAKTNISMAVVRSSIDSVKKKIKQNMEQIKILLVTNKQDSGLKFHRQLAPHGRLLNTHPEFNITKMDFQGEGNVEASIDELTDEFLSEFKIVYYLRQISYQPGKVKSTIDRLHKLGCKVILDIDDYWKLNADHMMYKQYKQAHVIEETEEAVRLVDHVITTTDYFAAIIEKLNPNVTVLPNCISPDDPQFKPRDIPNDRVRFGWIGGVYHRADIDSISENFCRIHKDKDVQDQYQICLGGYNVSHTATGIVPNLEYHAIEKSMTCNYHFKHYDNAYTTYLYTFTPAMEHISYDKDYRRIWSKDVFNYGQLYNEIDVALVPLISNEFNRCKSELKLVEAGTMGKAVIVSDTEPYSQWIKNGVNGIKIKESRNSIDWYMAMKKLIQEPNYRKDLAAGLKETIEEYFDMDTHNEARAELYKSLI